MTIFCISTAIVTAALLMFLVYALCAAASRADEVNAVLAEAEWRQRKEAQEKRRQAQWQSKEWMKP